MMLLQWTYKGQTSMGIEELEQVWNNEDVIVITVATIVVASLDH